MGFFSNLFKKKSYDEELKLKAEEMTKNSQVTDSYSNSNDAFCFVIEDVFSISGRGTIAVGRISSGSVKLNDFVTVNGIQAQVTGIEMFRKQVDTAIVNDEVGLLLQGISRDSVKAGDVISK